MQKVESVRLLMGFVVHKGWICATQIFRYLIKTMHKKVFILKLRIYIALLYYFYRTF